MNAVPATNGNSARDASEARRDRELSQDVVVVGGGPIGIETAIHCRRRGLDAVVMEAGELGHTISWWAPGTRWFSSNDRICIAGVPLHTVDQAKASREEYLNYLRSVVDHFGVPVTTFSRVVDASQVTHDHNGDSWQLDLIRGPDWNGEVKQTVRCRAVVLAIGGTDHPNRLCVPGEDLPHVDGFLREVHRYHGRKVLIVGGRNSAVEAAIRLQRAGANVVLSYHRSELPSDGIKYWLRPEIEGLIRSGRIEAHFDSRVRRIHDDVVELELGETGQMTIVPADDVLTLIGYRQDRSLFSAFDIEFSADGNRPQFDDVTMETSQPNVFLAGTAVGGTQSSKYQVFLENCHDHGPRIASALAKRLEAKNVDATVEVANSFRSIDTPLQRQIALQPES